MHDNKIRNFCIIAHIDHGKSTLADRLLEFTGTISPKEMKAQVLDDMDLERERGITIKAHAIQMTYAPDKNNVYSFNLIDTPGHVDFSYEVSRSLAACEGALLIVDASQGIEAQTISNMYLALEHDLSIIPVINKIDLPSADVNESKKQIREILGVNDDEILLTSAKVGTGIQKILDTIVERIPPPPSEDDKPVRALIFDSMFDPYRGAVAYIRVFEGKINQGDAIVFHATGKTFEAEEIGVMRIKRQKRDKLSSGEVGYLISGAKNVQDTKVGDTIVSEGDPDIDPLPGYRDPKPMVFAGLYPSNADNFEELRESLEKLQMNDAALVYEPETSKALGFGFRCGFLGLLHMEIVQERLEREYAIDLVTTIPNVQYRVLLTNDSESFIDNPVNLPEKSKIEHIEEPYIDAQIVTPNEYVGNIMKLARERRAEIGDTEYVDSKRSILHYKFPLSEVVFDFYDKLKSVTRGYASFDYDDYKYLRSDLTRLDILINGIPVDALSSIIHKDKSYEWGRKIAKKLKELIPRQLFDVIIQASIGTKVIARERIPPLKKNVTAKCYGGDITRKRKLLEKQREGKRRMKQIGRVEIPQEAFLAVLKL